MPSGPRFFIWVPHGMEAAEPEPIELAGIDQYPRLGWLRQESNQYFENPPTVAKHRSSSLQALLATPHGSGDDEIGTKFKWGM